MVTFENVCKSYAEKKVLHNFSFSFPQTGTIALLGPSGCGKTTLLRLLAGLEKADSGTIFLPQDARLSIVFQEDRLLEPLNVFDNVQIVLEDRSETQNQLVWESLEQCGLRESAKLYPAELSGGMRRRVAIARAMVYGGDILLLDEPFKGLDTQTKKQVAHYVLPPSASSKRLTLLITHDRQEALQYADTLLELDGPPLQILS